MPHNPNAPAAINDDADFGARFWYWTGASGRRYIHSIYPVDACPPLPGAVYLLVRREARGPRALAAHRFGPFSPGLGAGERRRAHEVHVHLLATGEAEAAHVLDDLRRGLGLDEPAVTLPQPCAGLPLFDATAA